MLLPLRNSLAPLTLPRVVAAAGGGGSRYPSAVLADSPTVYWRGGEASGTSAADASGNGHVGTYHSCTLGQTGALVGDSDTSIGVGSSSYVDQASTFNFAHATVEVWVYLTAYPTGDTLIGGFVQGIGGGLYDKCLVVDSSGLPGWYVYVAPSPWKAAGSTPLTTNAWHHLVGTCDGTSVILYVDGSSAATLALGDTYTGYSGPNLMLAGNSTGFANLTSGFVDEFAMYSGALSATRVLAHYNAGI